MKKTNSAPSIPKSSRASARRWKETRGLLQQALESWETAEAAPRGKAPRGGLLGQKAPAAELPGPQRRQLETLLKNLRKQLEELS